MSFHKQQLWPFPVRKKYVMMGRVDNFYRKCNGVEDEAVQLLYCLFTDQGEDVDWLLVQLLASNGRGISGEWAGISIREHKVFIKPAYILEDDYPEDYAIEMDREELIRLAREWQELIDKKVAPIYVYYKDGKFGVSDILPEGIE